VKPFTPFNQQAPLTRGLSCLEASAGTGKTYTISGLVLRLIAEQGLEIDEVLVVTFTRAATAELRDRIRRILVAAVHALQSVAPGPEEGGQHQAIEHLMNLAQDEETRRLMLQRLKRANEGFDEATITTIHGFCQRVLQRYAFESGVSLGGDDLADVTPLIHEVTADWWTKACYDADPFVIAHMENRAVNPEHLHALASATSVRRAIPLIPDTLRYLSRRFDEIGARRCKPIVRPTRPTSNPPCRSSKRLFTETRTSSISRSGNSRHH
jgi:ATP-dependent exoDNAse (exonuclease V) beta subunit